MRTKTLLVTAAALAAGLVSSFAQSSNVYSVNVVGYYNVTVPGGVSGGRLFYGNQLSNNVNDISIQLTNGPVSDPDGLLNTILNIWNNNTHTYKSYFFYTDADALNAFGISAGNGWYDATGTIFHDPMPQGAGGFIVNPRTTNINILVVGQVPQGPNSLTVAPGYNALAIAPPIATNLLYVNFPGKSDPDGLANDILNRWDPATQNYKSSFFYTDADAAGAFGIGYGDGWYDATGTRQDTNINFYPHVGEAFFLVRPSTGTSNWTYTFTVAP
jgi:hypothetical protein